jgi:sugar transferase EpsL
MRPRFDSYRRIGKRIFDLVGGIFLLLAALPLVLVIAAAVRVMLGSPVFFRQRRPGAHGKLFQIVKFRTLKIALDEHGIPLPDARTPDGFQAPDDDRMTGLGQWLRRTSLDELPELFNVLKGEMSLVGPRPLLVQYLERYSAEQMRRHEVLPGITGWAQVHGRQALEWEQRFKMDVWYVDNYSFLLDLRILAMTLSRVLSRADISMPGYSTGPEFLGNTGESMPLTLTGEEKNAGDRARLRSEKA